MKEWRIPVKWEMYGTVSIEADTLAEAIDIAKDEEGVIPLPDDGVHVYKSWQLDFDANDKTDVSLIRKVWNDGQEDEM